MEYTVQKLSQLAGVSARTIRYYDERFTAYYDKEQPGTAKFLRDAVHIYLGIDNK
jgi:DNA-binding transcriptional MerR regulator